MMRKSLLNFKNFVDSNVRHRIEGNKNDCINEDLVTVERTFDDIRQVCVCAHKKISSYLQSTSSSSASLPSTRTAYHSSTNSLSVTGYNVNNELNQQQDYEGGSLDDKRLRKLPVISFNRFLQKSSDHLRSDTLLALTFQQCSRLQAQLGSHFISYEHQIEQQCLRPLAQMLEHEIPNVVKCRKTFVRASQDLETARSRFVGASNKQQQHQQTNQHSQHNYVSTSVTSLMNNQQIGSNGTLIAQQQILQGTNKLEQLKKDLDEAGARADQAKDSYLTELFGFIAREPEIVGIFSKFYEIQADYNKAAFMAIQTSMPAVDCLLEDTPRRPVFGMALSEHLRVTQREISIVIEVCSDLLMRNGLDEEGLFRVSGSASKVKKFKNAIDAWFVSLASDHERLGATSGRYFIAQVLARYDDHQQLMRDSHTIAGVLKLHLREMPEPLLTYSLRERWLSGARCPTRDGARVKALASVCQALPKCHYDNLRYLIKLLALITSRSHVNKMSSSNLAIAIAPSLIWDPPVNSNPGASSPIMTGDQQHVTAASAAATDQQQQQQQQSMMSSVNMSTSLHAIIVDTLINNVDQIFPSAIPINQQQHQQQQQQSPQQESPQQQRTSATPSPSSLSALSTCTTSSKASIASGCSSLVSSSLVGPSPASTLSSSSSSSSSSLASGTSASATQAASCSSAPTACTVGQGKRPSVPPPNRPASSNSPSSITFIDANTATPYSANPMSIGYGPSHISQLASAPGTVPSGHKIRPPRPPPARTNVQVTSTTTGESKDRPGAQRTNDESINLMVSRTMVNNATKTNKNEHDEREHDDDSLDATDEPKMWSSLSDRRTSLSSISDDPTGDDQAGTNLSGSSSSWSSISTHSLRAYATAPVVGETNNEPKVSSRSSSESDRKTRTSHEAKTGQRKEAEQQAEDQQSDGQPSLVNTKNDVEVVANQTNNGQAETTEPPPPAKPPRSISPRITNL